MVSIVFSWTGAVFTAWYGLYFCAQFRRISALRSVAGLSPLGPGFDPRTVRVRFVEFKRALGQVYLPILLFSPVSIIPSVLYTHIHLHVALPEGQTDEVWKPSKKQCSFVNLGALARDSFSAIFTKLGDNICIHLEAENTLHFVREIVESIMNDIEYERNFVLVGKECTNEGS